MDLTGHKLGKYDIIKRLGQGGMAEVYQAFQPGVERHVAIKVMHRHLATTADFIDRFKREAKAVGRLQHPHIMRVIDFEAQDDVYYMVMEFMQGPTLADYVAAYKPLPVEEAIALTQQLLSALEYAHQQEMTHRDIKPANVMFLDDRCSHAILTDFGLARLLDDTNLTKTGTMLGTPTYMAPEMVRGEPSDQRADLYGIGVMLYEMVAGRPPYVGDSSYAVMLKQANEPLPWPRQFNPDIPVALEEIVVKALAKDPAERFQTATDFLAALHPLGTPTLSPKPKPPLPAPRPVSAMEEATVVSSPRGGQWGALAMAAGGVFMVALLMVAGVFLLPETAPPTTTVADLAPAPLPQGDYSGLWTVQAKTPTATLINQFTLTLDPVPPAPYYAIWLQAQGQLIALGTVTATEGRIAWQGEASETLWAADNQVWVTAETEAAPTRPGKVVFYGTGPATLLTPLAKLILPEGQFSLMLPQTLIALKHTGFMQDSIQATDLPMLLKHTEHVINILDGKTGPNFGDFDGSGKAENPGDGVGVRQYLVEAQQTLQQVTPLLPSQDPRHAHALQATEALSHTLDLSHEAIEVALRIFASDDLAEAQPHADALQQLVYQMQADNAAAPGTILAAYQASLHLAALPLLSTDKPAPADLPLKTVIITPTLSY